MSSGDDTKFCAEASKLSCIKTADEESRRQTISTLRARDDEADDMALRQSELLKPPKSAHFPFCSLYAELGNMIYRYLVVSSGDRNIYWSCENGIEVDPDAPNINLSILRVNRQIYHEASAILYGENRLCIFVLNHRFGETDKCRHLFRQKSAKSIPHIPAMRWGKRYVKGTKQKRTMFLHQFLKFRNFYIGILWLHPRYPKPVERLCLSLEKMCRLLAGKPDIKSLTISASRAPRDEDDASGQSYLVTVLEPLKLLRNVRTVDLSIEGLEDELKRTLQNIMMSEEGQADENGTKSLYHQITAEGVQ